MSDLLRVAARWQSAVRAGLILFTLLFGTPALADSVTDKAHETYAAALERIENEGLTVTPNLNRLIGWPGAEMSGMGPKQRARLLFSAYWEWRMAVNPEWASYVGHPGPQDRWKDWSRSAIETEAALERRSLAVARALPTDDLDESTRLSLELLIYDLDLIVAGQAFPEHWLQINQMYGVHTRIADVLGTMPLFKPVDVEAYLTRLQRIPALLTAITDLLEQGRENGVIPPQVALQTLPGQIARLTPEQAIDSALLKPLRDLSPALAAETRAMKRAGEIYAQSVRPAMQSLETYIRDRYLPAASADIAMTALPGGPDWYRWRIREMTTLDLDAEAIHQIGLDEVARIREEMEAVMASLDFSGDIPAFVAKIGQDASHFYTQEADLLRDYRALGKLVDGRLPRLFRRFPGLPYAIEPVPAYSAAGKSAAYYIPGTVEAGRPGTFYLNTYRLNEMPRYEMEALLLHEAVPGHHFQIALAQERQGLPTFRKHLRFTAYSEGWGLYAESLGPELGLYQDPYSHFGALTFEIWRAIRLVVDTGMHALGWSRQQAIDYFRANTGRPLRRIEAEVNRYLVLPGQALAYKLGQLKIQELRERAEGTLGEQFDIRAFHDEVLRHGALPLPVLEAQIDAWLSAQETNG